MIDLSKLPAPFIIEALDFETIYQAMKADYQQLMGGEWTAALESDPVTKLLELAAYREMQVRARINDACHAVMLAYAIGSDLDHIAADFGVQRLVIAEADNTTIPPTPAVMESDSRLRIRRQLAPEGFTVTGTYGEYLARTLESSPLILDANIVGPRIVFVGDEPTTTNGVPPGMVRVYLLSTLSGNIPDATLLETVSDYLNDPQRAKFNDTVQVLPGEIVNYSISAVLHIYPGPSADVVRQAALSAVYELTTSLFRLGYDINRALIFAALSVDGVQNSIITTPSVDLVMNENQAGKCTGITITVADSTYT